MITIFDYTDFRKFLSDYHEELKKENPRFSYRFLCAQGYKSGEFHQDTQRGKKPHSPIGNQTRPCA